MTSDLWSELDFVLQRTRAKERMLLSEWLTPKV